MNEYCYKSGKIKYHSAYKAYKEGEKIVKRGGGMARAYKCKWCNQYHLTSQHHRDEKPRGLHRKGH